MMDVLELIAERGCHCDAEEGDAHTCLDGMAEAEIASLRGELEERNDLLIELRGDAERVREREIKLEQVIRATREHLQVAEIAIHAAREAGEEV